MRKSSLFFISILIVLSMILSACATATPTPQTVIETVEVIKEVEGEEVTVIETVEVVVEVTPTPVPSPDKQKSKRPLPNTSWRKLWWLPVRRGFTVPLGRNCSDAVD